jgi:hypothetical protein
MRQITRQITQHILYDPSIRSDYEAGGGRPWNPSLYLQQENNDWAIIPTHRGKSYHDPFYFNEGLPRAVAQEFLRDDIRTDCGYALVYRRVIGVHAQNGTFYKSKVPDHVKAKQDEIWGDFYYAALYSSVSFALKHGCQRVAFFPTFGGFDKWQWASFIRAAHNAVRMHGSRSPLRVCENCVQGLPRFALDEEGLEFSSHINFEYREETHINDIIFLTFYPDSLKTETGPTSQST